MTNYSRLNTVAKHIKENPKEHDQMLWGKKTPCGTYFCFAGHAGIMFGKHEPVWEYYDEYKMDENRYVQDEKGDLIKIKVAYLKGFWVGGRRISVSSYARTILDLDYHSAAALFHESNSQETLFALIEEINAFGAVTKESRLEFPCFAEMYYDSDRIIDDLENDA